jgi:hypothetical protein
VKIPEFRPDPGYAVALAQMLTKLGQMLSKAGGPITICIAGGAAFHIYTGARYSGDVDATLSKRVIFDAEQLNVSYTDKAGHTRYLYYDTQYSDTLGLMHEDAYDDAIPVKVQGVDPKLLAVKLLSPVDLAVSKVARLTDKDREDIRALARAGLFTAKEFKDRALEALSGHNVSVDKIRTSIGIAVKDIEEVLR